MSAQDLRMRFPEAGQADTCTPALKGVNQAMRCSNFSRKALTVVLAAMLTLSVLGTASCTDGIDSTGSATATAGETASAFYRRFGFSDLPGTTRMVLRLI